MVLPVGRVKRRTIPTRPSDPVPPLISGLGRGVGGSSQDGDDLFLVHAAVALILTDSPCMERRPEGRPARAPASPGAVACACQLLSLPFQKIRFDTFEFL